MTRDREREARDALAFALDYPSLEAAAQGAERVAEAVGVLKVGLELFVSSGPPAVAMGKRQGCKVFLDLKLHDIPKTVERAVGAACQQGADYLTLHAAGGPKMLEAAAERAEKENTGLRLLAVTVLTSMDQSDLEAVGLHADPAEQVLQLARLAVGVGVHGLVCSPLEVSRLRTALGDDPILVTPGIRPARAGGAPDDQKRTGTPGEAIENGASLLVVGRPIRDAKQPLTSARSIRDEIAAALKRAG